MNPLAAIGNRGAVVVANCRGTNNDAVAARAEAVVAHHRIGGAVAEPACGGRTPRVGRAVQLCGGPGHQRNLGRDLHRALLEGAEIGHVVEPYDNGATREIIRSFASPRSLVLHTVFDTKKPAIATAHELGHYFLHGDGGSVVFSNREVAVAYVLARRDARDLEAKPRAQQGPQQCSILSQ